MCSCSQEELADIDLLQLLTISLVPVSRINGPDHDYVRSTPDDTVVGQAVGRFVPMEPGDGTAAVLVRIGHSVV